MSHKNIKKCPQCHTILTETGLSLECWACFTRRTKRAAAKLMERKTRTPWGPLAPGTLIMSKHGGWTRPGFIEEILHVIAGEAGGMSDFQKEEYLVERLVEHCNLYRGDATNCVRLARIVRAYMKITGERNEQ